MNDRSIDAESTPRAEFPKWWNDSGKYLCAHGSDGVVLQMIEVAAQRGYMAGFRRALDMQAAPQQAAQEADLAYREACRLANALFKNHYAHEPHYASGEVAWGLCDSTAGVISQIDNMVAPLVRPAPQHAAQAEPLIRQMLEALEEICPYYPGDDKTRAAAIAAARAWLNENGGQP